MASTPAPNPLILSTRGEERAADALLAALTTIGHAKPSTPVLNRKSRFFYKPTLSFVEDVETRKKMTLPREVEIIDQQIEDRRKKYQTEFPPKLNRNLQQVREFWLRDIAPYTLAAQSGAQQAQDVVQRTLDTQVDSTPLVQFQRMIQTATTIKMAQYIAKYLKLPPSSAQALIDSVTAKSPQREVVFYPDAANRRERQDKNPNLTPSPNSEEKLSE
jgi:hypothetical protein